MYHASHFTTDLFYCNLLVFLLTFFVLFRGFCSISYVLDVNLYTNRMQSSWILEIRNYFDRVKRRRETCVKHRNRPIAYILSMFRDCGHFSWHMSHCYLDWLWLSICSRCAIWCISNKYFCRGHYSECICGHCNAVIDFHATMSHTAVRHVLPVCEFVQFSICFVVSIVVVIVAVVAGLLVVNLSANMKLQNSKKRKWKKRRKKNWISKTEWICVGMWTFVYE